MNTAQNSGRHVAAVLQALLVAFLWATSWVLVKIGLIEVPPLVFAGLRYFSAFLILLVFLVLGRSRTQAAPLPRAAWFRLILLGLVLYSLAQGALFVSLSRLPAVTVNLLLSFSSLAVALLSAVGSSEKPTLLQWLGVALTLIGALVYFHPAVLPAAQWFGVIAALVAVMANAISTIVGRDLNRAGVHSPLQITVVSMGAGSAALLVTGILVEGLPSIGLRIWLFILWLAAVNTAFAFTLWNHTLRTLSAVESSVLNGTMMVWIPILAVVFLGEQVSLQQIIGLIAVGVGTLIVQLRARYRLGVRA